MSSGRPFQPKAQPKAPATVSPKAFRKAALGGSRRASHQAPPESADGPALHAPGVRALNTALAWLRGGRHGGPHPSEPRHSHANRAVPGTLPVGTDEDDPAGLDPAASLDELESDVDLGALRHPHPDALAEEPRAAEDVEQPRPPAPPVPGP
jgi:hypothetical protein